MKIIRRKTRVIKIGKISIGGSNPIAIQSMTKCKTSDVDKTVKQIKELEKCGCEIIRVAVKDISDAKAIKQIKRQVVLPVVADIHFNWRFAIEAIESGADKIRLNPGNIYKKQEIKEVVSALKSADIPLRVGLNSGSVKESSSGKSSMSDRLVRAALNYINIIEGFKFHNIVISLKASDCLDTVEVYRKMAKLCDYPMHLGVTATGSPFSGAIKSSIAVGALLMEGIGDTIRISLTDASKQEVAVAKAILESLGLRNFGPTIISCPTCGRCEVDLVRMVRELENRLTGPIGKPANRQTGKPIKLAVMGCVVNGPGEAREANLGIAFGKNEGLLFRNGKAIKKIPFSESIDTLLKEMEKLNA